MKAENNMTTAQHAQLCDLLEAQCGLRIGDALLGPAQEGIARVMARIEAHTFDDLISCASNPQNGVRDQLVNALVSRETWWFRDPDTFIALDELLAALEKSLGGGQDGRVRVWSAACSTGQEPYSIGMTILERHRRNGASPEFPPCYDIVATDVSPAALFLAVAGRYDPRTMERGLADDLRERYFRVDGMVFSIQNSLREAIRFRQHNLLDPVTDLGAGPFNLVFLRNVLEYYAPATQQALLSNVATAMASGGFLVLGEGETLPESGAFESAPGEQLSVYRRRS